MVSYQLYSEDHQDEWINIDVGTSARGEQVPAKKSEAPKHSQQGGRGSRQKTGLPAYLVGYKPLTPFEMASRDVDSDAARALRGELAAPSPVAAPSPPPTLSPAPATAAAPATPASTPKTDQKQHSSRAASKSKPALPAHLVGYKAPTPFELAQRDRDSDAARALRGESSGPSPVAAPAPVPAPAPAPAPAPVTTASRPTTEKKPQPSTGRSKAKPSLPAHLLGSQPLSPFEMAQRDLDGPAARALRGEPPSSSAVAGAPAPQTAPVEKAPASPTKATDTPKSDESARQQKSQRGGSKAKPSLPAHLMGQQASTPFEMAMRDLESHAARALRGESPTPLSSEAQQGILSFHPRSMELELLIMTQESRPVEINRLRSLSNSSTKSNNSLILYQPLNRLLTSSRNPACNSPLLNISHLPPHNHDQAHPHQVGLRTVETVSQVFSSHEAAVTLSVVARLSRVREVNTTPMSRFGGSRSG